ncbi:MAG: GntR family transcriptional regulator [Pseudomonadota bacterium]
MDAMVDTEGIETWATQIAHRNLREEILTDKSPGEQDPKTKRRRELLNTGARPVRKALKLMAFDALVARIHRFDFRAEPASKRNFEEIPLLRCNMEVTALRASLANAYAAWKDRLVLRHNTIKKAGQTGFEDAHKDCHMALLDKCNRPLALRFCSQLHDLNIGYRCRAGADRVARRFALLRSISRFWTTH